LPDAVSTMITGTSMQRALVLGAKGFIGSNLVNALSRRGVMVRSFDRPSVQPSGDGKVAADPLVEDFVGDFTSEADIASAVRGCQVIFHLVSTTIPKSSNLDPIFDVKSNVLGSIRLFERAVAEKVERIIFVSSGGTVYGIPGTTPISEEHSTNPICSYGITKLAIEKYLLLFSSLYGLKPVILRVSNPYGEWQRTQASQGAVAVFLGKVLRGELLEIWGDGSVVRDYIHISDVVRALVSSLEYEGTESVFNIGSGVGCSLNELVAIIERETGILARRKYVEGRSFDVPRSVLSVERAARELAWTPAMSLHKGISQTVSWLRSTGQYE
jgi:UDP-glucose 4-epimerase